MPDGQNNDDSIQRFGKVKFNEFPGEDPYRHAGQAWLQHAQAVLASHNLLAVAKGLGHPDAAKIIDTPESDFPDLSPGHPEYYRMQQAKLKAQRQNIVNMHARFAITVEYWNVLYSAISLSVQRNAPVFHQLLKEVCDMNRIHGDPRYDGFYDGPLAWKMVNSKALPPLDRRTKRDKDFYDAAKNLQKRNRLPSHCTSIEYERRGLAFLTKINPYLAQPYTVRDTAEYLIELMPESLDSDSRRLKKDLLKANDHQINLMEILMECSKVVFDDQKGSNSNTSNSLVTVDVDLPFHAMVLSETSGMDLVHLSNAPEDWHTSRCLLWHTRRRKRTVGRLALSHMLVGQRQEGREALAPESQNCTELRKRNVSQKHSGERNTCNQTCEH